MQLILFYRAEKFNRNFTKNDDIQGNSVENDFLLSRYGMKSVCFFMFR